MRPSNASLIRDNIRDLISDVRCAERDGLHDYADRCRDAVRRYFRGRHSAKIDRWGGIYTDDTQPMAVAAKVAVRRADGGGR